MELDSVKVSFEVSPQFGDLLEMVVELEPWRGLEEVKSMSVVATHAVYPRGRVLDSQWIWRRVKLSFNLP